MDAKISALIDSYRDEMVSLIDRWIAVPSVKDTPAENAPFGTEVRRMYDVAMEDCEKLGLTVRGFDGYAMDATLGSMDEEPIAVLAHLDVVPAGDGWNTDPFTATHVGDKIYGRGTSDDKGPAIASLMAMKAIKDAGLALKKPIRLILGCDEESGWEDMAYYSAHAKMPRVGFSPDAAFPLINTEKGMVHMFMTAPVSAEGLQVKKLFCGERVNVIPGECVCEVPNEAGLAEKVAAYAAKTGLPYETKVEGDSLVITATGIPGHSAYPEGRRNAIGMMLLLLEELGVQGCFRTLAQCVGMESNGEHLGIACRDEVSGPLTCNMGILHLENGVITCSLDCRCPVCADLPAIEQSIRDHLIGFTCIESSCKQPHHVPAESELVTALLGAYSEETGKPAAPQSTGGGTYAKVLECGVAFGSAFPEDEDLAHQAGEYLEVEKLLLAAKIYANALIRLCC